MKKVFLALVLVIQAGVCNAESPHVVDIPALTEKALSLPVIQCQRSTGGLYVCYASKGKYRATFMQIADGDIKYPKEQLRLCEHNECEIFVIDRPKNRRADLKKYSMKKKGRR